MCQVLEVSRSGYYAWRQRGPSPRQVVDDGLLVHVRVAFSESRETYGSPRIHRELRAKGVCVGRHRVARLMRADGIRVCLKTRFVATTDSNHDFGVAKNLLEREFAVDAPNCVWAGDITYIPTREGWLYLAAILDLYSRAVVGWAATDHLRAELALEALQMAFQRRRPPAGLLHHSDRGVQYACDAYREILAVEGCVASMSRRANCWDNAPVESFFGTLKRELVHRAEFATREDAKKALFDYIEVFYNRKRRHSTLGYLSPAEYEREAA